MNGSSNGARHDLEHRANAVRARLIGTIDALDRKRHEIFDIKLQLRRHSHQLFGALAGLAAGVLVTAGVALIRTRGRERRLRDERLRAVRRFWFHPERVAVRGSALGAALRMLLIAAASIATTSVGMRQMDRVRSRPRLPRPPTEPLGV